VKEIKIQIPEKQDFDEAMVGLVKFFLDSEAKSKIYVFLRKTGPSTAQEISKGSNLYPSSTREVLASMTKTGVVTRVKLDVVGSGKKPFVYEAISPSELFKARISGIESKINNLLNLDNIVKNGKTIKHSRVPYRVRVEKVVDEEGEKVVLVESEGGEEKTKK
jgi:sugar-specific transcriptional regulator TrmB